LKEYTCVLVSHHKDIGKTIEEWQKNGWRLHTYQATGFGTDVKHYLLFEREKNRDKSLSSEAAAAAAAAAAT